jgi:hypothetical protein
MIKFAPRGGMPLSSVATLLDHLSSDSIDDGISYFVNGTRKLAIQRWTAEEVTQTL